MRVASEKTEKVREDRPPAADRRRAGPTFTVRQALPEGVTPAEARAACLAAVEALAEGTRREGQR